jgi:hypothetical protein
MFGMGGLEKRMDKLEGSLDSLGRDLREYLQQSVELFTVFGEMSKNVDRQNARLDKETVDREQSVQRLHSRVDDIEKLEHEERGQISLIVWILGIFAVPLLGWGVWVTSNIFTIRNQPCTTESTSAGATPGATAAASSDR